MAKRLKPCGTNAAYRRHLDRGEETCDPCKKAHSEYNGNLESARTRYTALCKLEQRHWDEALALRSVIPLGEGRRSKILRELRRRHQEEFHDILDTLRRDSV